MPEPINLAVLGSTGSIGCNTLEVVRELRHLHVHSLSGYRNVALLKQQASEFSPKIVCVADEASGASFDATNSSTDWRFGNHHLETLASDPEVDIVVASIVGQAGLNSTLAAAAAGKRIALANKESMVVAGSLLTQTARKTGRRSFPLTASTTPSGRRHWQANATKSGGSF
ncbi:MAG: hypothetical protein R3C03_21110 [Pirellulaceae bacterium]